MVTHWPLSITWTCLPRTPGTPCPGCRPGGGRGRRPGGCRGTALASPWRPHGPGLEAASSSSQDTTSHRYAENISNADKNNKIDYYCPEAWLVVLLRPRRGPTSYCIPVRAWLRLGCTGHYSTGKQLLRRMHHFRYFSSAT